MRRAALTLALLCGCIPLDSTGVPKKNPDFIVVGHRGAPNVAAENTIPSYQAALELGARGLELDICVTADGLAVVWHDRDPDDTIAVARQNGVEGLLYRPFVPPGGSPYRVPIDQLSSSDFFAQYGYVREGSDARDPSVVIPTLAEFLAWAAARPELRSIYLDIKVARPEHARLILDLVAAAGLRDVTVYAMSIRRDIVEAMIAAAPPPGVRVVFDHEESGALDSSQDLGLRDLSIGLTALRSESEVLDEVDAAVAERAKKRIDSVTVWTLDEPMQMTVFLYHQVDAILTNDPARLDRIWRATL